MPFVFISILGDRTLRAKSVRGRAGQVQLPISDPGRAMGAVSSAAGQTQGGRRQLQLQQLEDGFRTDLGQGPRQSRATRSRTVPALSPDAADLGLWREQLTPLWMVYWWPGASVI